MTSPLIAVIDWVMRITNRRRTVIRVAAISVFAFFACPSDPQTKTWLPVLDQPEWRDGETATYHITRNDSVLFKTHTVLRFDEELVESGPHGQPGAVPTAVVTTTIEPVEAPTFFFDSTVMVFTRDSFMPLRSFRDLETDLASFSIDSRYEPGRVHISKQTIDGVEDRVLRLAAHAYEPEMLWFLMRAVVPDPSTHFQVKTVVPISQRIRSVDITVLGTKLVPTALGNIMCREFSVKTGSKEKRFWYELDQPRRLIGMTDPTNKTRMLLVDYVPSGTDTLQVHVP